MRDSNLQISDVVYVHGSPVPWHGAVSPTGRASITFELGECGSRSLGSDAILTFVALLQSEAPAPERLDLATEARERAVSASPERLAASAPKPSPAPAQRKAVGSAASAPAPAREPEPVRVSKAQRPLVVAPSDDVVPERKKPGPKPNPNSKRAIRERQKAARAAS